jgi:hypothetical protein
MDTIADAAMLVRGTKMPDDPLLKIFPQIDQKLRGTPRYLLDEHAIHTAVELTLGRPKVLLEAMRHLRIPYPRIWVEWPESGRAKLRETFGEQGYVGPDRPLPKRLGFFLECTDDSGRRGMATWCWTSPEHEELSGDFPNIGAISPFFDLDARLEQPSERIAGFLRGNLARMWKDHPIQLEALFDIWRTAQHGPSEWGFEYCSILEQQGRLNDHLGMMWADVYGEYIIIWAIMLLLTSSRKTVEYRAVDRSRINKLRQKRKQFLLWDHTEVTMHLGQQHAVGQRRQPLGFTRKSPRIHMVSSYLNRRNDKHWVVMPFMRGSGDIIHRQINVRA